MKKREKRDIDLGKRIRSIRLERGLQLAWLAKRVGCSPQQLQKYENASNRIGYSRLCRIAKALEMGTDLIAPIFP